MKPANPANPAPPAELPAETQIPNAGAQTTREPEKQSPNRETSRTRGGRHKGEPRKAFPPAVGSGSTAPIRLKNKTKKMKKETWKIVLQVMITILTAIGTTLGVTSCM
ncbi:hypothetical protein ETF27_08570 [Prevotella brunnea]|uniref:Smalltalk protein n=1 Tax=Prevotella brunnea TaxID=2508867 RepID=A0A5C8GE90_9BACT|nr:smalltalk protein [Prevotella brunnea]TXJ60174.1 hypothetical protein ETF27_08570 [Prevotella brunnea]